MALSALFHNESVPVHLRTKSVIDQILHHRDAMETACIRMHFQTIKYPMVATSFYDSKFIARYGDGSTALFFEDN